MESTLSLLVAATAHLNGQKAPLDKAIYAALVEECAEVVPLHSRGKVNAAMKAVAGTSKPRPQGGIALPFYKKWGISKEATGLIGTLYQAAIAHCLAVRHFTQKAWDKEKAERKALRASSPKEERQSEWSFARIMAVRRNIARRKAA